MLHTVCDPIKWNWRAQGRPAVGTRSRLALMSAIGESRLPRWPPFHGSFDKRGQARTRGDHDEPQFLEENEQANLRRDFRAHQTGNEGGDSVLGYFVATPEVYI